MTGVEFTPGTVAVAKVRDIPGTRITRFDHGWACAADPDDFFLDEQIAAGNDVTDIRPLVVLDLDGFDAAQAARSLDDAANGQIPSPGHYDERRTVVFHVAQAIREQTRPPKPEEPTGLGAVVEDAEGDCWVRCRRAGHQGLLGVEWENERTCSHLPWHAINAVRLLSPGWSAPEATVHASMYRDGLPGTLCRPGWEPRVTTVANHVTCPECRQRIDGGNVLLGGVTR